MKRNLILVAAMLGAALTISSCKKNDAARTGTDLPNDELTPAEVSMIKAAGLHESGATRVKDGYLIEGDLLLTAAELSALSGSKGPELIVGNTEQYHTFNLVTGLPRIIKVKYTGTRTTISTALNNALVRYNALGLVLAFQRITSGTAHITVSDVTGTTYIATAGFPGGGNPYNSIKFNTAYSTWNSNTLTTIIAHEIGHCIGMVHTDYMDRSYSCGGAHYSEGSAGFGAIHIPGTPTGPDANSWMLACIGNGVNRPFNANDIRALNYLY